MSNRQNEHVPRAAAAAAQAARPELSQLERVSDDTRSVDDDSPDIIDDWAPWLRYGVDVSQRSALLLSALVERGDALLADELAGLPLRLRFPFETILDAREFAEPAGYSLLRILPDGDSCFERCQGADNRPVIVFDPRAGHGPGIGGSKRDSELGMALHRGHPVYFVAHHMQPCPGQTLARVHHAWRRFVAEVASRHPGERPALYGNCQAGWGVALLAADCCGVAGPTILNGAPLSYWGGESGVNPMRLVGGLTGGVWATRLLADLSGGLFDGAWLAQNFEQLDPGQAVLGKYRRLFSHPESERGRFIDFERWWGEYCFLTGDEMGAIAENLFIGNRLEEGVFRICEGCHADLRRLRSPMFVFASSGDNITPPQQALGWIPVVWPTTDSLVAAGQRVCYLIHDTVGHLGIFVSADVARREHRAILDNLDALESLEPGLYEMRILAPSVANDCLEAQYAVRFEPRRVEDLPRAQVPSAFARVRELSEILDVWYRGTLGPLTRSVVAPGLSGFLKWMHPMRSTRLAWAHPLNPFAFAIDIAAATAQATRAPLPAHSPWLQSETRALDASAVLWDSWRESRDRLSEWLFSALYQAGLSNEGSAVLPLPNAVSIDSTVSDSRMAGSRHPVAAAKGHGKDQARA